MNNNVIVIGAGGAGLVSAIYAHEAGANVKVITKEYPTRAQTCMAQGGINAAFGNTKTDSIEDHINNTLNSAHGLAELDAVQFLCRNALDAVQWLDNIGVCFSRTKDAKIAQRTLGGASAPRACYAQDYTGLKILHTLYDKCLSLGIEILSEKFLLDFIVEDNTVYGAKILDIKTSDIELYKCDSIIIATGGYSCIYDKHSTNSSATSGDGIATALRAGARVSDMEFIQFHPTAMKNSSVLISESARGAGGYLLNSKGKRFTNELAPRDEVARAIYNEMKKGENIFLDIRHLGESFIDEELPQERKLAKLYENIDPVYELIPIKPAAHYTMGGIEVDNTSQTTINGLFAVGECANHRVHGANRLGGNSLLELVVFGKLAGESASKYHSKKSNKKIQASKIEFKSLLNQDTKLDFYQIKEKLANLFYQNVGISRDKDSLQKTLVILEDYISKLPKMGATDTSKIYNTNLKEFLEFKNMLEINKLVLLGAIHRDESRGAHFRSDKPNEDEDFKKHTILDKNGVVA